MVYINHEYKFIFIENPKSGSSSILKALEKSLRITITREMFPAVAHLTSYEVSKKVSKEIWNTYKKVTTQRDPFKRFCSSINFNLHKFDKTQEGLQKHLGNNKNCVFCLPQEEFTKNCDFIIHVENIQQDYDDFCKLVGIPTTKVQNHNKAKRVIFTEKYLFKLW